MSQFSDGGVWIPTWSGSGGCKNWTPEKDVMNASLNLGSGTGCFERDSAQRRRTIFIAGISRMLLR